jgi:hypothetical protein
MASTAVNTLALVGWLCSSWREKPRCCLPFPLLFPLASPAFPLRAQTPTGLVEPAYLSANLSTSVASPLPLSSHYHATPPRFQHSSFTLLKEPGFLLHLRAGLSSHFYSLKSLLLAFSNSVLHSLGSGSLLHLNRQDALHIIRALLPLQSPRGCIMTTLLVAF